MEPSTATAVPSASSLRQDFYALPVNGPLKNAPIVSLRSLEDGGHAFDHGQRPGSSSVWNKLVGLGRREHEIEPVPLHDEVRLDEGERPLKSLKSRRWKKRKCAAMSCTTVSVLTLCFFGIVHLVNVFSSFVPLLRDDVAVSHHFVPQWSFDKGPVSPPVDLTKDVTPIHCHSHNDYWRRIPLYEALAYGCTGVEADVWLFDEELFVGHNTNALTTNRTFRTMYVDPLVEMLDRENAVNDHTTAGTQAKNGVFVKEPTQTLVLLVDFKNNGSEIFPFVNSQLAALREKNYLAYYDGEKVIGGPITVVATGNAPYDLITADPNYRDIFFDAPLDRLYKDPDSVPTHVEKRESGQGSVGTDEDSVFDSTNSYYASVNFGSSIGWIWWGRLSEKQLKLIRGQIQGAKEQGLKSRYWGTPSWPIGLRNHVWDVLVREGVDYLNGDDLQGMTRGDWNIRRHHGWLG